MRTAKQRRPKDGQSERGQITLLVAAMITTFLLFFMFVVNIGMLVNAKINLQNAADLAAYSGAATQARQLNAISFLNYEMRRQYKKFLFRYHVVGNMAQKSKTASCPGGTPVDQTGSNGNRIWTPSGCSNDDYGVPAVCIVFNSSDNYCQIPSSPAIPMPTGGFASALDGITSALIQQLQALEAIRLQKCDDIAAINSLVTGLWLFNADPTLAKLKGTIQNAGDPKMSKNLDTVAAISTGIGIIPRLVILGHRIEHSLAYYANFPPQKDITTSKMGTLLQEHDPGAVERTAQAFYSAANTLGPHIFAPSDGEEGLEMTEILPTSGGDRANLLRLTPITAKFDVYYLKPTPKAAAGGSGPTTGTPAAGTSQPKDCINIPSIMQIKGINVGYYKDPSVLTYYAVKLKAKARILFSPFGDLTLKAYAAAQPFGSRIGPVLTGDDFVKVGVQSNKDPSGFLCLAGNSSSGAGGGCNGTPNLPVSQGDTTANGWWRNEIINQYFQFLTDPNTIPAGQSLSGREFERGYGAAMVPNPYERGRYNIINDLGGTADDPYNTGSGNAFMRFFVGGGGTLEQNSYAFWAPIISLDEGGFAAGLKDSIKEILNEATTGAQADSAPVQQLAEQIDNYVDSLKSTPGEDGETFNIVRLVNPVMGPDPNGQLAPVGGLPANIFMNSRPDFMTSWNDVNEKDLEERGRIGYSVKFVAFKTLMNKQMATDGSTIPTNDVPTDTDADTAVDLQALQH